VRGEGLDAKENRATEILATCLQLSEPFRQSFLKSLFEGTGRPLPKELSENGSIEVLTQLPTESFGTIDLALKTNLYCLVIEVKVGDKEDSRHLDQLGRYAKWLRLSFPEYALFTLVRDHDPHFKHGDVVKHWTWSDVYKMANELSHSCQESTDRTLLEAFCEYLRLEEIVSNMDYTKLLDYGKGWAADEALQALFNKTTELLETTTPDLVTKLFDSKGWTPCFQYGRDSWDNIFGKGFNKKVYAWFCSPTTDEDCQQGCEFRFDIWLWDRDHGHDWDRTKKRLPSWFTQLNQKGCSRGSYSRRHWEWLDWKQGQELDLERRYVYCVSPNLPVNEESLKNIQAVAQQLVDRVRSCMTLVEGLSK
jgi:hypothetical protein